METRIIEETRGDGVKLYWAQVRTRWLGFKVWRYTDNRPAYSLKEAKQRADGLKKTHLRSKVLSTRIL